MAITQTPSELFTVGHGPILAVVLHEYCSGLEALDAEMGYCYRRKPAQSPGCHSSFHYGVSGCIVHQYVDLTNTAWGFGVTPPTCPEPLCPPDECESCTGITVAQYQTDLDGNPPVLPPLVTGVDGTVNGSVIHVALTGLCVRNDSDCCKLFPDTTEDCDCGRSRVYQCLVKSLCDIYVATGLTPTQSTLLIHCEELICLDIDQLVIDILACINAPPPPVIPCQCTPTPEQITLTLEDLPPGGDLTLGTELVGSDGQTYTYAPVLNEVTTSTGGVINPEVSYATTGKRKFMVNDPVNPGSVTLTVPATLTGNNEVWIKNLSVNPLVISTSAGLIDGKVNIQLDGVLVGAYPFGNNGGESVHLVWVASLNEWKAL